MSVFAARWTFAFFVILTALYITACSTGNDDDDDAAPADDDAVDDDSDDDQDDDVDDDVDDDAGDDVDPNACWTDLAAGEKVVLAEGFIKTEGIAFSGGALYVTTEDGVASVEPSGEWETIVTGIDYPVGMTAAPDGALFVCDFGGSAIPLIPNDGKIHRVDPQSLERTVVADGIPNPNVLTWTPDGAFLVSDNMGSVIFKMTLEGDVTNWLEDIPFPDGMAYSADRRTLYVADTISPSSPVYRVALDENGAPTSFDTLTELEAVSWPDGLALDENGALYVTEYRLGKIARIDPETGDYDFVATGMTTPASMAFGEGPDFDPCSVYVTEYDGHRVWRLSLGIHGLPAWDE